MKNYQTAALLAAVLFVSAPCPDAHSQTLRGMATAIDGDTIRMQDGKRIRLWGIDAPELEQWCGDYQAGKVAKAFLEHVIDKRPVTCTVKTTDQYGRPVALCTSADGYDMGRAMVAAGHAWAFVRYSADYAKDEAKAKADKLGLHRFQCLEAWEWRKQNGHGQPPTPTLKGSR